MKKYNTEQALVYSSQAGFPSVPSKTKTNTNIKLYKSLIVESTPYRARIQC